MVPRDASTLAVRPVVVLVLVRLDNILRPPIPRAPLQDVSKVHIRAARTSRWETNRVRAVEMDGALVFGLVGEADNRFLALFDDESRTRGHPVIASHLCWLLTRVDVLFKRLDVDLVVVDWLVRYRVVDLSGFVVSAAAFFLSHLLQGGGSPGGLLDLWDGQRLAEEPMIWLALPVFCRRLLDEAGEANIGQAQRRVQHRCKVKAKTGRQACLPAGTSRRGMPGINSLCLCSLP